MGEEKVEEEESVVAMATMGGPEERGGCRDANRDDYPNILPIPGPNHPNQMKFSVLMNSRIRTGFETKSKTIQKRTYLIINIFNIFHNLYNSKLEIP